MGRTQYRLYEGVRRRGTLAAIVGSRSGAGIAVACLLVVGGVWGLGQSEHSPFQGSAELGRRQDRIQSSKGTSGYATTKYGYRVKVRTSSGSLPTSTPSSIADPTSAVIVRDTLQGGTVADADTVAAAPSVGLSPTASESSPETTPSAAAPPAALPVATAPPTSTAAVTVSVPAAGTTISVPAPVTADLTNPAKKDAAMQLVSSAENSSLDWRAQYAYIQDIGDGRGYTAGIIGFCSGTGDMLELVQYYTRLRPGNGLAQYLSALQQVNGTSSHAGLGTAFEAAWRAAAADPLFQQAQNDERDRVYFNPAVAQAKADGLRALGQFMYYDALVMHGPGNDAVSFGGIRAAALRQAKTPAQGGDESAYLNAFLNARVAAMMTEAAHEDVSRVETAQRLFLQAGNFDLNTPLTWKVYGDPYSIQ